MPEGVRTRADVEEFLRERGEEDVLLADGFDSAFLGTATRCGQPPIAVYDYWRCVDVLVERDQMTRDGAVEFMDFNVTGAWVGEGTPAFVETE
jgi:hypothetical protein